MVDQIFRRRPNDDLLLVVLSEAPIHINDFKSHCITGNRSFLRIHSSESCF